MDGRPLIELAHMFYRVCATIVNEERRLMETSQKFSPFYLARKWGFRDLTECLVHDVVSYAFARWAIIFSSVVRLFVAGERFTRRSS